MAMDQSHGLTVRSLKANILMAKSTELDSSSGVMVAITQASFTKITYRGQASINGPMAERLKDSGIIIKWKGKEYSLGPTEGSMKATISVIKKKEQAYFSGLMEENTLVNGRMGSNMGQGPTLCQQANRNQESGLMARNYTGLKNNLTKPNNDTNKRIKLIIE